LTLILKQLGAGVKYMQLPCFSFSIGYRIRPDWNPSIAPFIVTFDLSSLPICSLHQVRNVILVDQSGKKRNWMEVQYFAESIETPSVWSRNQKCSLWNLSLI